MIAIAWANHWTTGSDGPTAAMIFLMVIPYLVIAVGAGVLVHYLRRSLRRETPGGDGR